jgi:hypothetical protein
MPSTPGLGTAAAFCAIVRPPPAPGPDALKKPGIASPALPREVADYRYTAA